MTYKECYGILTTCMSEQNVETVSRDWCDQQIILSKANNGKKIRTVTWNALFNNHLFEQVNEDEFRPIFKSKSKKRKSNNDKVFSIKKKHNQYYAQYIEEAITALINNEPIPNNVKDFEFTDFEIQKMNADAKDIVNEVFADSAEATYIGRKTSSESGDIIIDAKEIEVKYCKRENATYYNTTVQYFDHFGLRPFKDFLIEYKVLEYLEQFFGPKVYEGVSPVSQEESSDWRKCHKAEYEHLKKLEAAARKAYAQYVFDFLSADLDRVKKFANDMLTKDTSGKHAPDLMIVYHYDKHEVVKFTKDELLSMTNYSKFIKRGYTFKFDRFHTTIAWQNGTGLNNPTIRVYVN